MYKRLADHFRKEMSSASISNTDKASGSTTNGGGQDNAKNDLFKAILNNEDNYSFVLSLSGKKIQASSGKADLRRAYLLLSAKVHPDKNPGNQEAVKAFQTLLSAYERLANPEKFDEDADEKPAKKRQKTEKFTRSNAGCYKTKIKCPQCKTEWGLPITGLEDAAYNFLMMGLKQYICHVCSCQFGCMTALHFCPHCRKEFAYDPDDYHRKITCGNVRCSKEFGFMMFKVTDRREKEVRQEAKDLHEQRMKKAIQKKRRANRANRDDGESSSNKEHLQEQLFILQLRNSCPRCGWEIERGDCGEEIREHLADCNDKEKIKAYQQEMAEKEASSRSKADAVENEEELLALKQWEMNGRQVGQLWMLSDAMLKRQCESFGLPIKGKRHELIKELSQHIRSQERLMITDGKSKVSTTGETGYDTCSLKHADQEDLPQNLNSLDKEQLQDLCASYNVVFNAKKDVKKDLIKKFEQARYKGSDQLLMLGYGDEGKGKRKAIKARDEDDEDFVPDN